MIPKFIVEIACKNGWRNGVYDDMWLCSPHVTMASMGFWDALGKRFGWASPVNKAHEFLDIVLEQGDTRKWWDEMALVKEKK